MNETLKLSIIISILCGFSSGIGGVATSFFKIKNKKYVSGFEQLTAGIMTSIVCLEMLPESIQILNVFLEVLCVILGVVCVYLIDYYINKYNNNKYNNNSIISLVIMISMAFHNIIEGLAIGSSYSYSISLGITVLIGMILHDIPEGLVVGISNNIAGKTGLRNIINTILVGGVTGIGVFLGNLVGNVNEYFVGINLSIASGVMLYIISCELIPSSYSYYSSKRVNLSYILGMIIGAIIVYM